MLVQVFFFLQCYKSAQYENTSKHRAVLEGTYKRSALLQVRKQVFGEQLAREVCFAYLLGSMDCLLERSYHIPTHSTHETRGKEGLLAIYLQIKRLACLFQQSAIITILLFGSGLTCLYGLLERSYHAQTHTPARPKLNLIERFVLGRSRPFRPLAEPYVYRFICRTV